MRHSQSMPRALDTNNSISSNFSLKTSMLTTLNAKDKIPEQVVTKITTEADILVRLLLTEDGEQRIVHKGVGRHEEIVSFIEGAHYPLELFKPLQEIQQPDDLCVEDK